MAKKYSVENTTSTPARPILLVIGKSAGALGKNFKNLATDGMPEVLTEKEYVGIKEVLDRYEAAGMVRVKCIDDTPKVDKKTEPVIKTGAEGDDEDLKAMRQAAADLGIRSWQTMKKSTLEEAIAKANLAKDTQKEE